MADSHVHRITEWFGLEGTLTTIWFQPPCHGQRHLPLDQVAQSPIHLALNTARDGAATDSLDNLCQGLTTLIVKNMLRNRRNSVSCNSLASTRIFPPVLHPALWLTMCFPLTGTAHGFSVHGISQANILSAVHPCPPSNQSIILAHFQLTEFTGEK